jgi:predicted kinase
MPADDAGGTGHDALVSAAAVRDRSGVISAGDIVIVSGPPGSGKSTVAAALASGFERAVHLESDWFYRCIRAGFVPPELPSAHGQNTAVMDIATDAASGYSAAGYVVVWDGVVGPWFLDRVVRRLSRRQVALRYLVLGTSRDTALDRVRRRDGTIDASGAAAMCDAFSCDGTS